MNFVESVKVKFKKKCAFITFSSIFCCIVVQYSDYNILFYVIFPASSEQMTFKNTSKYIQ